MFGERRVIIWASRGKYTRWWKPPYKSEDFLCRMDKYKKQRVSLGSPLYIYFLYVFFLFFFFILAAALFFRSFVHVHSLAFVLPGETILTLVFSHLLQLCVCSFIIFYPFKREKLFDEHYAPVQFCGVGMMDFGKWGVEVEATNGELATDRFANVR